MTESEAINEFQSNIDLPYGCSISDEASRMAINAIENKMKKENAEGCIGCAFEDVEEWELPCRKCKRASKDYWRAKE